MFVICAEADEAFVSGYLVRALGLPSERVLLLGQLTPGNGFLTELERSVEQSRMTVAVMSGAMASDRWATVAEQLASHAAVVGKRIVPLLLADVHVPLRLDARVGLDYRDRQRWEAETRRLRDLLDQEEPIDEEPACPYPGVRSFSSADAGRFHGREREIADVVERLRCGQREILIVGPSGSGKSSLLMAGVLPRLESLGTETVLVMDQLEKILAFPDEERRRFASIVCALRARSSCQMLFVLRSDFRGALARSSLWPGLRGRLATVEVSPLRADDLRRAIEGPARQLGVYLEPALVERLLGEAASEPGAMSMVQEVMNQLWIFGRSRRYVTLAAYESLGGCGRNGLAVAMSRRADAILPGLDAEQQVLARRILLRLVSFGEGRSHTRRRQPLAALRSPSNRPEDFDVTVDRLISGRLLTVDGDAETGQVVVDLSHEALARDWPTLNDLVRDHQKGEQERRLWESKAAEWAWRGRGRASLLDQDELSDAREWLASDASREVGHSEEVSQLVTSSIHAVDQASRRRRRGQLLSAQLGACVAVLAVVIALMSREPMTYDGTAPAALAVHPTTGSRSL